MFSVVTDEGSTESGSLIDEIVREGARRMLAAAGRALDPPADHEPDRVDVRHGQAPHQGHPRCRRPCRRPRDGVQARGVRPGALTRGHRRPPRAARPRGRPLRKRPAARTRRARGLRAMW
ncbi:hypothetical protein SGPA1_22001 [Streptomyces misionensis JCM 4497]